MALQPAHFLLVAGIGRSLYQRNTGVGRSQVDNHGRTLRALVSRGFGVGVGMPRDGVGVALRESDEGTDD